MEKVQRKKELRKTCFEKRFAKPMAWIEIEQVAKASPHRLLNETMMVAARASNGK